MHCETFGKLRAQTCVSAHQNIITVSENTTISSQMQAVKLPTILSPSFGRGLRPSPPPQKKVNGSSLSAEEQFLIFGLRCREDKTGEEVRLFIREGRQERPASGTRPTGARSENCLPPLNVRRAVFQPISEYKAEVLQSGRCKLDTIHKMEILHTWAQVASMEEREMSQIELGAKQDWANYEASFRDSNPLKNEQKAQDSFSKRLKLEEKEKALLRKIYRIQDAIEIEEMHLKEDREREEREEEGSKQSPEDLEKLTWEYVNFMSVNEENDKVLKYYKDEKEKLKMNADRIEEEIRSIALCIEEEKVKKNKVKAEVKMINNIKDSRKMKIWTKTEQLCEELAKVQESYGEQAYSPAYPLMILLQLEDWISDSLDLIENMPAERLCKIQKRICKHYQIREQEQKHIRREALLEERRQRRQERALSHSVKLTGKKLMPRSQPPKKMRKKEKPVETKKTKEDLYAHFVE
ncbi:stress response protein NST1-like [Carassius auratus]|uniref:Stress response protein NST1-like n=1 Tax=Carassius auratus TaxID=7957 RepID=A0A6P6QHR7_CARAU|nr:stress response protein NST1-like [Carassius auratus]